MRWLNSSDTSGLVEMMKSFMRGKKNQGNCYTQGYIAVYNKIVADSQ